MPKNIQKLYILLPKYIQSSWKRKQNIYRKNRKKITFYSKKLSLKIYFYWKKSWPEKKNFNIYFFIVKDSNKNKCSFLRFQSFSKRILHPNVKFLEKVILLFVFWALFTCMALLLSCLFARISCNFVHMKEIYIFYIFIAVNITKKIYKFRKL